MKFSLQSGDASSMSSEEAAAQFADLAREFCTWIEGTPLGQEDEAFIAQWLARLHAGALGLPEVVPDYCDEFSEIPEAELDAVRGNLRSFSGMYYRECFDPDPLLTEEPVMGDVGDDLLDTYKDLKRGLVLFDRGQAFEALWFWSFNHRIHWGHHAVGAMFALQCLPTGRHE